MSLKYPFLQKRHRKVNNFVQWKIFITQEFPKTDTNVDIVEYYHYKNILLY